MSRCTGFILLNGSQCTFDEASCTSDHITRIYKVNQITDMRIQIHQLKSENSELKNGAQTMQGEIDKLKEDAEIAAEIILNEHRSTQRLDQANQDLEAKNESLNDCVARLQQQIRTHAAEHESSQQEITRLDKAQRDMQNINNATTDKATESQIRKLSNQVDVLTRNQASLTQRICQDKNVLDACKQDNARLKIQLQQQSEAHAAEIERLDKAQLEAQENTKKKDEEISQLVANNTMSLIQLNQARQEKTDLEARVCQMARIIDDITSKLGESRICADCSRQTCIDAQNQLQTTHDKLIATQQQLELVVKSNNELQHRIQTDQMTSDMEYVNIEPSSIPTMKCSSDCQLINQKLALVVKDGILGGSHFCLGLMLQALNSCGLNLVHCV